MPEAGQELATETVVVEQPTQPSLAELAAFAFNEQLPAPVIETTAVVETPEPVVTTVTPDLYGYESADALKAAIEEYKTLKAAPPVQQTAAEIAFANDESKRIHELLREGKTKEVRSYLEAQELLANVDTMTSEQQLKLHIKMNNPLFDQELIDDEYNSLYTIDEEGIDDPTKLRKEKVKLQQRLSNDVLKAKEFFSTYKQKIELPEIQQAQANTPDADYENYKASIAKNLEYHKNVIVPTLNALKDSDLLTTATIKDENNQMDFSVNVAVEQADLDAAKNDVQDFAKFVDDNFYDDKGMLIGSKITQMILRYKNFDKYAQTIARQAVNAERKRVIGKETPAPRVNGQYSEATEKTELQRQADFAFSV